MKSLLRIVITTIILGGLILAGAIYYQNSTQTSLPEQPQPVPLADNGTVSLTAAATSPHGATQATIVGQSIQDLAVHNGELYVGYGDYAANTGPINVEALNLTDNTFTDKLSIPTETINLWREINGHLYAPNIDPRIDWNKNVGYATDESGTWENKNVTPFVHVYDIASTNGQDLWLAGSSVTGENETSATIKRSTDGGQTWTTERTQKSNTPTADEVDRYYWLASAGGKLYAQPDITPKPAIIEVWDNGTWRTIPSGTNGAPDPLRDARTVASYKDKVYLGSPQGTKVIDSATNTISIPAGSPPATDFYVDNDHLYALGSDTAVYATTDGETWKRYPLQQASGVPNPGYQTLAVTGNTVYLGTFTTPIIYTGQLPQ